MKYRKLVKQLNNLQLFRIFMERRNKTVRIKTKKKAFVSVLLSFVMIMGLFFVPKVNAEEQPDQPNTISFKQVEKDMDMVDGIILRVDGNDQETPISYPAGLISENIGSLNLPENQEFQKAVVKDATTQTETEIARIGTYEEKIYYSLTDQQDIGITLKDGQNIVFICSTQYTITYQPNDYGTITGPETILNGENLNITVKANDYYHIESVTMNGEKLSLSSENSKNESIQIESSKIKGNITINATFEYDTSYRIIEKNAWIEDEHYHGYTDEDNPKGGIQQGDVCWNDNTEVIEDVNPGGSVTFWLYSQSNYGGPTWRLNMLKFNDENINVPLSYNQGDSISTEMSNGSNVTIKLIHEDWQIEWKGDSGLTTRTIYEVTIDHVKESIDISGNFKDASKSEIMLTGLEGIQTSGMVKETSGLNYDGIKEGTNRHYYYDFQNEDGDKVYDAYYTIDGSYNIILYSVKPGYNPYTLNLSAIYDGNTIENIESILQNNSNSIQYDIDSIAQFIDKSEYRYFGTTDTNIFGYIHNEKTYSVQEWIKKAEEYGHTYGIILKQNEAKNQIININANPYQYNLIFDLDDGNGLDSSKYHLQEGKYIEVDSEGNVITYTLKDGSANAYMPIQNPTKADHIFLGWQLYYDGKPVEDVDLLTSNQVFTINEETIKYSNGDSQKDIGHTFTFKAIWATETQSADDAIYTIDVYCEQPNGQYEIKQSISGIGTVGEELNYVSDKDKYNPNTNLYYLNENSPKSKLTINQLLDDDIEINPNYKENNTIKLYYSYYRYDLTVTKDAVGDYADLSRDWTIDVTLTNENDSSLQDKKFEDGSKSIQLDNGQGQLSLKDEESFTFANLIKGTQFKVEEKDVPTDYEVTYKINNDEKDSVSNQSLTSDTTVTVINTMKDINIPDTNIPTSGMNNTITMLAIGSLGIIGIVTLLWYWRKKHV